MKRKQAIWWMLTIGAISCISVVNANDNTAEVMRQDSEVRTTNNNRWTKAVGIYYAKRSFEAHDKTENPRARTVDVGNNTVAVSFPISGIPRPDLPETRKMVASFCAKLPTGQPVEKDAAYEIGRLFSEVYEMERTESDKYYQDHVASMAPEAITEISNIAEALPATESRVWVDYASITMKNTDLMMTKYRKVCDEYL